MTHTVNPDLFSYYHAPQSMQKKRFTFKMDFKKYTENWVLHLGLVFSILLILGVYHFVEFPSYPVEEIVTGETLQDRQQVQNLQHEAAIFEENKDPITALEKKVQALKVQIGTAPVSDNLVQLEQLYTDIVDLEDSGKVTSHLLTVKIDTLLAIAQTFLKGGMYNEAAEAMTKTLTISEEFYDGASQELGVIYDVAAEIYQSLGQVGAYFDYREKALLIMQYNNRIDADALSSNFNNLAELLRQDGQYDRADRHYSIALKLLEKKYGPQDARSALVLNNLGMNNLENRQFTKAELYLKQASYLLVQSQGYDHATTQKVILNLKTLLKSQGRFKEAAMI